MKRTAGFKLLVEMVLSVVRCTDFRFIACVGPSAKALGYFHSVRIADTRKNDLQRLR